MIEIRPHGEDTLAERCTGSAVIMRYRESRGRGVDEEIHGGRQTVVWKYDGVYKPKSSTTRRFGYFGLS